MVRVAGGGGIFCRHAYSLYHMTYICNSGAICPLVLYIRLQQLDKPPSDFLCNVDILITMH